jgi:hypothetical protein
MVDGGQKVPNYFSYTTVASLHIMQAVMSLAELNYLKLYVGGIGKMYLEVYTAERVGFAEGPEFGLFEGHTLLIIKALYLYSGACQPGKCADLTHYVAQVPI